MTLIELRKELRTLVRMMRDPHTRPKGTHENIEFDRSWTPATDVEHVALLLEALDKAEEALDVIASCPPDAIHLMPLAAQAALRDLKAGAA